MIIIYLYVLVIGLVVGSFLNVVIHRLPNEQSIIKPRSHCPSCQKQLKWQQLIPVFSYLIQRGRCANCQTSISVKYPLIEIVTGFIFVFIFYLHGLTWLTLVYCIILACFIAIFMIDKEHMIIPDSINLIILIVGVIASLTGVTISFIDAIIGSIAGGSVLWLLAIASRGGMGGGDIKFLFAVGWFTGWQLVFPLLFVASILGLSFSIIIMAREGFKRNKKIPFGPFLVTAATIVILWREDIITWYLSLMF